MANDKHFVFAASAMVLSPVHMEIDEFERSIQIATHQTKCRQFRFVDVHGHDRVPVVRQRELMRLVVAGCKRERIERFVDRAGGENIDRRLDASSAQRILLSPNIRPVLTVVPIGNMTRRNHRQHNEHSHLSHLSANHVDTPSFIRKRRRAKEGVECARGNIRTTLVTESSRFI